VWDGYAAVLNAQSDYRVLRRLVPRAVINPPDGTPTRSGLFVDVETTGLDSSRDEIIELAMVPFTFGMNGLVYEVKRPLRQLSAPSRALTPEITQLTGLSSHDLAGREIDLFEVSKVVNRADLIVAHNARFDRPFLERLSPVFKDKPWACSMTQIDWRAMGFESTKLEYLGLKSGFFFDGHRAVIDCFAGIELLTTTYASTTGLKLMLTNALVSSWRIIVTGSPFDANAILRERGYRWNSGENGRKRGWEIEVDEERKQGELALLHSAPFKRATISVDRNTPFERFSDR